MPFFDLDNFIKAARAIAQGLDPYLLPDVYYPLPLYFVFLPFIGLPTPVAQVIWTAIELLILVAVLRRRAFAVILFMPVFVALLMGQIVMPMLGLFVLLQSGLFGGLALALLSLKPQLVLFVAPWMLGRWWIHDRRQIVWFAFTLAVLALAAFIVQPDWLARWLAVSGRRLRAPIAPSLWGALAFLPALVWIALVGLITLVAVVWAWRTNRFDIIATVNFLVNPVSISYDLTLLTPLVNNAHAWIGITLISWLAFTISAWQLNEGAYVLITLAVLAVLLRQKPKRTVSKEDSVKLC